MEAVRTLLHRLAVAALGAQVLGALAAAVFYVQMGRAVHAAHPDGSLGLDGLALAGAVVFVFLSLGAAAICGVVLALVALRDPLARALAPLPAVLGVLGFGAWLLSGDPGDEAAVRIALGVETAVLVTTAASALVGWPARGASR